MEYPVIQIDVKKALLSAEGATTLEVRTDIPFGKLTALFGPSGAGKTTLLRMLAGLLKPDVGTIRVGEAIWFDRSRRINVPPQQRHIGMMFQDYALFPNMTIEQNIQFARDDGDSSFTQKLLEVFELGEFAKRKPAQLSGGQKQRVALARALARKPEVLLLDEPLSALDTDMRLALQKEIAIVHEMFGATTIFVSHDVQEVTRLASHIIRIDRGKVIATGSPEHVFANTSTPG